MPGQYWPAVWDGRIPIHPIDRLGLVYVEVPKAACSSIKRALAPWLGAGVPEGHGRLHQWVGYLYARNLDELGEWLSVRWADYQRFTVVRHPVARWLSLYVDKIDPLAVGNPDAWLAASGESRFWDDIHAAPAAAIVGLVQWYHHVGKVEHIADTERWLRAVTGEQITIGHENVSSRSVQLSTASRTRLRRHYAIDLQTFEYR